MCAKKEVLHLVDSIQQNQNMRDAVILVHGDHGARIGFKQRCKQCVFERSPKVKPKRDWRKTFVAIKIPGVEGRVIKTPVRLDKLYKHLLDTNFTRLDSSEVQRTHDSPY
jgi:hypothetical protein